MNNLEQEIMEQIAIYNVSIGRISCDFMKERLRRDIISNSVLMNLYGKKDGNIALAEYVNHISNVKSKLYTSNDSDLNIMKLYEYIRLTTFKDNLLVKGCEKYIESLGDSSISPAFTGKATELGTLRYFRDLLPTGMESVITSVNVLCPRDFDIPSTRDVMIVNTESGMKSADVVNYNGNLSSMNSDFKVNFYSGDVKPFMVSKDLLTQARREVSYMLIEDLGIDEMSKMIINDGMSDYEKQCAIIGCVSTMLNQSNMPVKFNLVNINGRLMEIGKVMELFFIYNGIDYTISDTAKEDSIYNVIVKGEEYSLDPKDMFSSSYGDVTERLHYKEYNNIREYPVFEDAILLSDTWKYISFGKKAMENDKGIEKSLVG